MRAERNIFSHDSRANKRTSFNYTFLKVKISGLFLINFFSATRNKLQAGDTTQMIINN